MPARSLRHVELDLGVDEVAEGAVDDHLLQLAALRAVDGRPVGAATLAQPAEVDLAHDPGLRR